MSSSGFIIRNEPAAPVRAVALTGPIAGGKSLALSFFKELGAETADADDVTHALYAADGPLAPALAAIFGPQVMAPDGAVDRKILGRIVFSDPSARAVLETTTHPLIRERLLAWRDSIRARDAIGVVAIPLLFESGMAADWDATACLVVPDDVLLPRLLARGHSESEARARLAAQLPPSEKAARADYWLRNDSTPDALRASCAALLRHLSPPR
jgi:dephospho-CoA kinase